MLRSLKCRSFLSDLFVPYTPYIVDINVNGYSFFFEERKNYTREVEVRMRLKIFTPSTLPLCKC